eukprot:CAMPEP_0115302544 /NCGR_PEP_ID=MMETSP0270-20121206/70438_1 /TAXON_ID=71861 /ORGANISM="Scrippsiella trochoidea, Strain CCMP3099" /LENGTH=161 /DNA_ID=CAMNT_0002720475 /DNA_START=65 /DNA_END=550 /DNA_ORIENTATION=-
MAWRTKHYLPLSNASRSTLHCLQVTACPSFTMRHRGQGQPPERRAHLSRAVDMMSCRAEKSAASSSAPSGPAMISHSGGSCDPQFGINAPSSGLDFRKRAHIAADQACGGAASVPCSSYSRRLASSPRMYQALWASMNRSSISGLRVPPTRSGCSSFINRT